MKLSDLPANPLYKVLVTMRDGGGYRAYYGSKIANAAKASQTVNSDYDTYDSAVVCADSEADAKDIHPRGPDYSMDNECDLGCWAKRESIAVEYIGEAKDGLPRGVVCASFNAG